MSELQLSPELKILVALRLRAGEGVIWDPGRSNTCLSLAVASKEWKRILRDLTRQGFLKREVRKGYWLTKPQARSLTYYTISQTGLQYLKELGL